MAEIAGRKKTRDSIAIHQRREEFHRLRRKARRQIIARQQGRTIGLKRGHQGFTGLRQLAQVNRSGRGVASATEESEQPLRDPCSSARRPDHHRQIQVVHEEPPHGQPLAPGGIQRGTERVFKLPLKRRCHSAAHDVMDEPEPGRRDGLKHCIPRRLACDQLRSIDRLER